MDPGLGDLGVCLCRFGYFPSVQAPLIHLLYCAFVCAYLWSVLSGPYQGFSQAFSMFCQDCLVQCRLLSITFDFVPVIFLSTWPLGIVACWMLCLDVASPTEYSLILSNKFMLEVHLSLTCHTTSSCAYAHQTMWGLLF